MGHPKNHRSRPTAAPQPEPNEESLSLSLNINHQLCATMAASAVASEHSFMTGGGSGSGRVSMEPEESDDDEQDEPDHADEQLLPAPLSWFEQSNMTEEEQEAEAALSSPSLLLTQSAVSVSSSFVLENSRADDVGHSVADAPSQTDDPPLSPQRKIPPVSSIASPHSFHQQSQIHSLFPPADTPTTTGICGDSTLHQKPVVRYEQEDDDDDEEVDRLKRVTIRPNMSSSSTSQAAAAAAAAATLLRPHTLPSPSWTEISRQILPAAARELWSNSLQQLCHTAQLSYAQKNKWYRNYTDLYGQEGGAPPGYNVYAFHHQQHSNNNSDRNNTSTVQLPAHLPELPPFSSLPWVDRQLVREWRTYLPDDDNSNNNGNVHGNGEENEEDFDADDFDRARTLVPMTLPRPVWQKSEVCSACRKTFGPARLRHHCRNCGYSFCQLHSSATQKLAHLGYNPQVPERVCDVCHDLLLEQHLAERVAWRLARCRDYNHNHNKNNGEHGDGVSLCSSSLAPYFETGVDTLEDVALRITNVALQMAKSIPLGAQATVAVETVNVLRKHGLTGIYTIMLRREFLAAADLLRKTLGINRTAWPLSVHELSAAIFYALAQHRAMRGMNPEREEWIHTIRGTTSTDFPPNLAVSAVLENDTDDGNNNNNQVNHSGSGRGTSDAYNLEGAAVRISHLVSSNITTGPETTIRANGEPPPPSSFVPVYDIVPAATLESVIFYAPLALNFIYSPREVDMQLLAAQQGWRLLYAYLHQEVLQGQKASDRPASAVFIHEQRKVICLAIRGTTTINDVVTDMRQTPVPFPENVVVQHHAEHGDWTTVSRGQGLAVSGMAGAAFNLYREHVDSMMLFARQGYEVVLVGHSLGGGVATLLGVLFHGDMKEEFGHVNDGDDEAIPLHVYAYGTPCCIDARLAECVDSFVTTVVLHDDVVPRLTPTSCRGLLKHLLHIRDTWVRHHLPDDLMAITERARTVWAPRWREGFTLSTSTYSIKRYCRNKLKYSRKQLLFVTDKLIGDSMSAPPQQSPTNKKKKSSSKGKIMEQGILFAPSKESNTETAGANESIAEDEQGPHLLVDYMGGIDCRVEGVAIDGEEFFDADEHLVEEESEYDEFEDAVDDLDRLEEILPAAGDETKQSSNDRQRSTSSSDGGDGANVDDDETPGAVVLSETPLPRLYTPGKIIHIYSHRGVYKAAYVPRTFRELRRISLAGNMLSDHKCKEYYEALLEVRSARAAPEGPPRWTAFDEDDTCSNCASRFTWASTCDSAAQAARDKHNCRSCGTLVCDPCSTNRIPLASLGLTVPVRVCDRCYNDIDGVLTSLPADNASSSKHQRSTRNHADEPPQDNNNFYSKPERRRERRSAVVDELASRIQASPLSAP
jgi:Lipase (class 3)/FYVE zinc finger